MKKSLTIITLGLLSLGALVGCNQASATYEDKTSQSIYGRLTNFSAGPNDVKAGDTLTFTVTPSKYFDVNKITNNGVPCQRVSKNVEEGTYVYQTKIVEGKNSLVASYSVDPTIDFVDEFKMPISDDLFKAVYNNKDKSKKDGLDFRRCGIEKVQAPLKWSSGKKTSSGAFVNYVDGDTTHVETTNLGYTVKIRYLSIDTPESTSEIEEWGLSASNYSKFIYTGDESYIKDIRGNAGQNLADNPHGVTSLILMSQDASKNAEKMTEADLKLGETVDGPYAATTDGNQRNLAYVWYATVDNPKRTDFRCLNLEMVYQGFSFGIGSMESTSEYFYKMFDAANLSAEANGRHLYSDDEDLNYYYYDELGVQTLKLEDLYKSAPKDPDIGYIPESSYADKKTLYKIHGYVTRKVGTSFYMQDKPSYTEEEVRQGKVYGIYVFTYSETIITVGDEVNVVGAVSSYGGTFQIQGISFHTLGHDPVRDLEIVSNGNTIVPIRVTGEQFNSLKLPSVLVEITDNIWFNNFQSTYKSELSDLGEGGAEEINGYNDAYPFYNTSNAPIFYGSFGETDNSESLNEETKTSSSGVRYDDRVIRFTVDQEILVRYGTEICYSYKFFTGGSYLYNPEGAEYANREQDNPFKDKTVTRTYNRKAVKPAEAGHGLVCISTGYESTSGKRKMTAKICSGRAADIILTEIVDQ